MDYIKRAVEYKNEGHTFKELHDVFKISSATYYDWKKKIENGHYKVKKKVERKRLIDKEQLQLAIKEKPDSYLHELAELFDCTPQAIFYALKKLKITLKKRPLPIPKNPKKNGKNFCRNYQKFR